jgi:U2-associated protein SR140
VESLQDERKVPKTFVRGGVIQKGDDPSTGRAPSPTAAAIGSEYRLEPRRPAIQSEGFEDLGDSAPPPPGGGRKTRELDSLLQELKTNPGMTASESHHGRGGGRGAGEPPGRGASLPASFVGDSDQGTTNIYVGNLAPSVTEEALSAMFSRYGPVLSVKVMW